MDLQKLCSILDCTNELLSEMGHFRNIAVDTNQQCEACVKVIRAADPIDFKQASMFAAKVMLMMSWNTTQKEAVLAEVGRKVQREPF